MKIAVASTNGKNLDLHFGKASSMYIYEYDEKNDELRFIEHRQIEIDSKLKHQNTKIIENIKDCEVAICEQYGAKASIHAKDAGLKLIKEEGSVENSLNNYINHIKFMKTIKI